MKKNLLAIAITATLTLSPSVQASDIELNSNTQKASYTLGADIAKNFTTKNIDIDASAFMAGLQDALNAKPLKLSESEMQASINTLKANMQAREAAKDAKKGEVNAKAGIDFMNANKDKEGVKLLSNGMQYKVITAGSGEFPGDDDLITANYRGTLISGKQFDSSYDRGTPLEFKMGGVIRGWREALTRMKPGAKWEVYIPPALAYGTKGAGKSIGPNETLIFTIEFIKAEKPAS